MVFAVKDRHKEDAMYERVAVPFNDQYGDSPSHDSRAVIFRNASVVHLGITAVDPRNGTSIEIVIRKSDLPAFLQEPRCSGTGLSDD
jgi:hypothetical protein